MIGLPNPWLILAGAALIAATATGAWFAGDANGADRVKARTTAEHLVAVELADRVAHAQQATADISATAAAERSAFLAALAVKGRASTVEYYRANPAADRPCLSLDRVRAVTDADAAASAASPAGNRDAAVRDTGAPPARPVGG